MSFREGETVAVDVHGSAYDGLVGVVSGYHRARGGRVTHYRVDFPQRPADPYAKWPVSNWFRADELKVQT